MKRKLHERNWYRYLWLNMRQLERTYEHERRRLALEWRSDRDTTSHMRMLASSGRLIATLIRCASSTREMLGL